MNLLSSAPVLVVKAVNNRTLYVVITPAIGSALYNEDVLEACLNEYLALAPRLTGWRAYSDGMSIEIFLHGDIDWKSGASWL